MHPPVGAMDGAVLDGVELPDPPVRAAPLRWRELQGRIVLFVAHVLHVGHCCGREIFDEHIPPIQKARAVMLVQLGRRHL